MTVQQLIAYHTLIAIYRIRQSKEPEHLADILTKDNRYGHIIMKNTLDYIGTALYSGELYFGIGCQKHLENLTKLENSRKISEIGLNLM